MSAVLKTNVPHVASLVDQHPCRSTRPFRPSPLCKVMSFPDNNSSDDPSQSHTVTSADDPDGSRLVSETSKDISLDEGSLPSYPSSPRLSSSSALALAGASHVHPVSLTGKCSPSARTRSPVPWGKLTKNEMLLLVQAARAETVMAAEYARAANEREKEARERECKVMQEAWLREEKLRQDVQRREGYVQTRELMLNKMMETYEVMWQERINKLESEMETRWQRLSKGSSH